MGKSSNTCVYLDRSLKLLTDDHNDFVAFYPKEVITDTPGLTQFKQTGLFVI